LLKPEKGEFPIIRKFIDGMLTPRQEDEDADQNIYAHSWNHLGVRPLYDGKINTAQILVLVGPPDTGKSVFQNLIVTPLLGGRVAKPYPYMVGRTDFNEDLFESEHLKCDDETPPRDHETRMLYASELKKLAADEYHWCQGKGKKAITLPPFWRVTVSINDDPDYLPAIPVNDDTLKDKMIILKTYPNATVRLVEKLGGKESFADKIQEELPAYLYWLLYEFQIPKELQDTRYGLKAFQHPEIVEAVEETTPQMQLLAGLEDIFSGEMKTFSVLHIWKSLSLEVLPREVRPQSMTTLGRYLTTLDKVAPDKIKKVRDKKGVAYTLDFRKGRKPGVRAGS
jgi:hypothetical protein